MLKKMLFTLAIPAATFFGAKAQGTSNPDLPIQLLTHDFQPLRGLDDPGLRGKLKEQLEANPKWKKLIAERRLSVALVDLSNPFDIRYADVNGQNMMYAASLPKIAVLLAAEDAIAKGELKNTPEVQSDMRLMISKSNNQATTRMIDRLGFEKIEDILTDPRYGLYDPEHGGGLWVGKRYAAGGKRNPDPMKGLSHAATAEQVARFYYLLAMGKLVDCESSEHMLEFMHDPALHHKFVNTLDRSAPHADLYRKSGSWRTYHSDSVLVWGEGWQRYILVGLADDPEGEKIMRKLVTSVEDVLKEDAVLAGKMTASRGAVSRE